MGVGFHGLQIALLAKRRGAKYSRTISIGRQHHYLDEPTLRSTFQRFGLALSQNEASQILADPFSEALFRKLGANEVDSIDASDYEGARILHDFNEPITPSLYQKYTAVLDFGSLEHVFHFPNAIKNATDLLEVGGYFISMSIANNFMGHGFYQFSPELFFSYLPANGFSNVEVYLAPYREFPYFFRATEPSELGGRVELVNSEPVQLGVIARKVKHMPAAVLPTQSDYQQQFWRGRDINRRVKSTRIDPALNRALVEHRARIAALVSWPELMSPALVNGFENNLQYQLVDPAKD